MEKLKLLRKEKGLKQIDVANYLQVSRQAYSSYENESREPDLETLKKLSAFFNVSIDELIGNDQFNWKKELKSENLFFDNKETELIKAFRSLNPTMQNYILQMVKNAVSMGDTTLNNNINQRSS